MQLLSKPGKRCGSNKPSKKLSQINSLINRLAIFTLDSKLIPLNVIFNISMKNRSIPIVFFWGANCLETNLVPGKPRCLTIKPYLGVFWDARQHERLIFLISIGCQISYVFVVGRSLRVWGLKRPQKTGYVSIFWDRSKVKGDNWSLKSPTKNLYILIAEVCLFCSSIPLWWEDCHIVELLHIVIVASLCCSRYCWRTVWLHYGRQLVDGKYFDDLT